MSKLEQPDGKGTDDVSYVTLAGWRKEMDKCPVVDPAGAPRDIPSIKSGSCRAHTFAN